MVKSLWKEFSFKTCRWNSTLTFPAQIPQWPIGSPKGLMTRSAPVCLSNRFSELPSTHDDRTKQSQEMSFFFPFGEA